MKSIYLVLVYILCCYATFAQTNQVKVIDDASGQYLLVNGEKFIANGMNWAHMPIGKNFNYSLWEQPDDIIKAALDNEMSLLKNMGVNTVRIYTGIQPKWITYIYENYGIYTMLNHSFGRYGLTIDGVWTPVTKYDDPATKELLMSEVTDLAQTYKNTPGLLLYLLGNENNYGLFWAGAETEDFPDEEDQRRAVGESRGRPMYKLMNDAALKIKSINNDVPVAICNGDLLFLDIIAEECPDVDIYGTNMYRGASFGDAFERVKKEYGKPILFTEFGSDAFNAKDNQEDQKMQAHYMVENWKEIYQNAAGLGKAENSLGGYTFQFSDGWWKFGQTTNLDVHDNNASWSNGGYEIDHVEGKNNMNEEWFGICAKGFSNSRGLYELYPRAAYYALKEAHKLDPFAEGTNLDFVNNYFNNISIMDAVLRARGDKAALGGGGSNKISISTLRAEFTTFNTGGSLLTTPENADPDANTFPDQQGFDHMQSYYIGVEGRPSPNMRAKVDFNIVGNVATNPIDEIFYENRARPITVDTPDGEVVLEDNERVTVYQAEYEWNAEHFDLRGFYRTGHYHWGYEGDFFGLYPEANYGPNLDIYNGEILGFELDGKGVADGFKAAFGPQLWWGANPTMLFKYRTEIKHWTVTGIYHRDVETDLEFDENGRRVLDQNQVRSGVIPPWPTERATLVFERDFGRFGLTLGGIWGGSPLNDSSYQDITDDGQVVIDKIDSDDNWGWKGKLTYQGGKFQWYAQGGVSGLVAGGGYDQTMTLTGWKLKDVGTGNLSNVLTGFTYNIGKWQIAPNFLWQQPLVDPMPNDVAAPGRIRNIIDDPFAVRSNREKTAGEILITFDPTPGTYMYEWNNDRAEDASFAMSAGFVYHDNKSTTDGHVGFLADRTFFAFGNTVPEEDLWEAHTRMVSKISPELGLIGNFYYGKGQANGDDERNIYRYGADLRALYKNWKVQGHVKIDDWGPFDYHRDFNLTYPVQLMLDVSYSLSKPDWFVLPNTRIGIRGTWRSLDENSPRYLPNQTPVGTFNGDPILSAAGFPDGTEWEIRTYIHINIGK
ncbi:glycoside hydrolase family 2 TIM barrel-domain containing protein [Flavobacteriaceae bacterium 14752]|uniref:glycoside hydrolase family 2 TIM barrel-domain containing protein n=1 Tax=Mesohalobacter salilacus TaxID=2491711 RepID=UPI000F63E6FE|nr:glycosidase [Flavobacteriaceae bacterium 14752]